MFTYIDWQQRLIFFFETKVKQILSKNRKVSDLWQSNELFFHYI